MDLERFKTDDEIVKYLYKQVNNITPLNECRLYKEEQLQITDDVLLLRNCIEWIIRANTVILNIKYALSQSLANAEKMKCPLEETDNRVKYSYYLEDAVYRDIVLWDIYKQLLNEYYKCGYSKDDTYSIFTFLKYNKFEGDTSNNILEYLETENHQKVRQALRNSFAHSVDSTSTYIFHSKSNGTVKPELQYFLPNHPFENLNIIIEDVHNLLCFMHDTIKIINNFREDKILFYNVSTTMPCGVILKYKDLWNLCILQDNYEKIIIPCEHYCEKAHKYNDTYVCKPISIYYRRIHTSKNKYDGTLTPNLSFEEMKKNIDNNK